MATLATASSRLDQHTPVGMFASAGAALAVGLLCAFAGTPTEVTGTLVATAGGLPAAIEYSLRGRGRNVADDISRIRQGELRRPISLVVAMLATALLLIDSIIGGIVGAVIGGFAISEGAAQMLWLIASLVVLVCGFLVSSYASHYLGKRPYLWTGVAVVVCCVVRLLIVLLVFDGLDWMVVGEIVVGFLALIVVCEAGVWFGRRHHAKFLAKKLARIEHKASQKTPLSPAPQPSPSPDLLDQLKKLADLRHAGVLTEEEFQAKKMEMLARL